MLLASDNDPCAEEATALIRRAVMTAFCTVMRDTSLPPMVVMGLAASVVGTIYREISDAHCGDGACPCGWHPSTRKDIETLQVALAAAADALPEVDLYRIKTMGRA